MRNEDKQDVSAIMNVYKHDLYHLQMRKCTMLHRCFEVGETGGMAKHNFAQNNVQSVNKNKSDLSVIF